MKKAANTYMIILLVVLLLVPVVTARFTGSERDETENRMTAELPSLQGGFRNVWNRKLMEETEAWMNDHIGSRPLFRSVFNNLLHRLLRISTEEKVVFGKEDWLFYTYSGNLDLAKGTYPLDGEKLARIAELQRGIVDSYLEKGQRYLLLLTPSKVSIYPEYLPFEANETGNGPSDRIEAALNADGRRVAVNTRKALLAGKESGELLFYKTDTHWNARGCYIAYQELLGCLRPGEEPIRVDEFETGKREGDLNRLLGLETEADREDSPIPVYDWTAIREKPEDVLTDLTKRAFEEEGAEYYEPVVYHNSGKAGTGTLVLYGDSMTSDWIYLPAYMAEHYESVVFLRLKHLSPEIEDYVKATDIVYQTTERFILSRLMDLEKPDVE